MTITSTALLLCNGVWQDPVTYNVSVMGVFSTLSATRMPSPARRITVYSLLTGEPYERGTIRLECAEETVGYIVRLAERSVEMGDEGRRHAAISLEDFRFPHPGVFHFFLLCDDRTIGEQTVTVREIH